MTPGNVEEAFKVSLFEIFPELSSKEISFEHSLRDLGANSIDRAEIIMLTLSRLKLKIPLVNFAQCKNIGELVGVFHKQGMN